VAVASDRVDAVAGDSVELEGTRWHRQGPIGGAGSFDGGDKPWSVTVVATGEELRSLAVGRLAGDRPLVPDQLELRACVCARGGSLSHTRATLSGAEARSEVRP